MAETLMKSFIDYHFFYTLSFTFCAACIVAIIDIIEQLLHRAVQRDQMEFEKQTFWRFPSSYIHFHGATSYATSVNTLIYDYEEQVDWNLLSKFVTNRAFHSSHHVSNEEVNEHLLSLSYSSFVRGYRKYYCNSSMVSIEDNKRQQLILNFELFDKSLKFAFYNQISDKILTYKKLLAIIRWYELNGSIFFSGFLPFNLQHFKIFFLFGSNSAYIKYILQCDLTTLRFSLFNKLSDCDSDASLFFFILYDYYGCFLTEGEDYVHTKLNASGVE